jgi:pimeloyl-ACP methyl ester carboxylesterase
MGNNKGRSLLGGALAGAVGAISFRQYQYFRRDMIEAGRRLQDGSQVVETRAGPVEVGTRGRGKKPVLMVHGAGGGYDQALYFSGFLDDSYQQIAVSRFGYLRTPMPTDPSPEAQAEAHAALLDALEIQKSIIVGMSAGGPSTIYFALRYPERCTALILVSAVTMPLDLNIPGLDFGLWLAFRHDFLDWFMVRVGWLLFYPWVGLPPEVRKRLSPEDRKWLAEFITTVIPLGFRKEGIQADRRRLTKIRPMPLAEIQVPTLIIHSVDDPMVPVSNAQHAAQEIGNASSLILPDGGHLLLGHHAEVQSKVANFVEEKVPATT